MRDLCGHKMREIKFRAWDKKKGQFVTVYNLPIEGSIADLKWSLKPEDENIILMQFTGLHDKNGKEIWEGDVVNVTRDLVAKISPAIGVIKYFGDHFGISDRVEGHHTSLYDVAYSKCFYWHDVEVLGNIYENPELLKDKVTA